MSKRGPNDSEICIKAGVLIYPVYISREKQRGDLKSGFWYIAVSNNGKEHVYPKEIKKGMTLNGKDFYVQITRVYSHWAEKIRSHGVK